MTSTFTPVTGTLGGSLIGLSASILLLGNGDVLGASGIVSSFLKHPIKAALDPLTQWRVTFLSSFLITSTAYGTFIDPSLIEKLSSSDGPNISALGYTIAGLFVGLGTKLSNGCTSGHGICGLARFSPRSLVAVLTFMTTGVFTGSLISSHFRTLVPVTGITETSSSIGTSFVVLVSALCLPMIFRSSTTTTPPRQAQNKDTTPVLEGTVIQCERKTPIAILSGSLFALGLAISGMVNNAKVLNFLNITGIVEGSWDGTLMTVMGSGLMVSMIGYQWIPNHSFLFPKHFLLKGPIFCNACDGFKSVPTHTVIDRPLIAGAALFGIGWGLAGVCPGPAIFLAAIGVTPILTYWWPSYWIGATIGDIIKRKM